MASFDGATRYDRHDYHDNGKRNAYETTVRPRNKSVDRHTTSSGSKQGRDDIILLRHKRLGLEYLRFVAAQHGHRGRPLTRAMISLWRMVAMEFGMCRSGRNGGSSGSITVGYGKLRAQRGGTRS